MKRRRRRQSLPSAAQLLENRALLTGPSAALDVAFAGSGTVAHPQAFGNAVAVQDDGKVLLGSGSTAQVTRYNADGTLDTAFGTGGSVDVDAVNTNISGSFTTDIELQDDGKILVVGTGDTLFRFNSDGTADTSFGTNGEIPTVQSSFEHELAVDSAGRILVIGFSSATATVARYMPDGSLDTSFGTGGQVSSLPGANGFFGDIDVDASDRVVVATEDIIRLNTDGSFDTSFDGDGIVNSPNALLRLDIANDGTIYAAGATSTSSASDAVVEAYDDSGNQIAIATNPSESAYLGLVVQADDQVVVSSSELLSGFTAGSVFRYASDLTADSAFGAISLGSNSGIRDLAIDGNHRIVFAGVSGSQAVAGRITPGNLVPVTSSDSSTVVEDATNDTAGGDVTANDIDHNGDTLTIVAIDGNAGDVGNQLPMTYGTLLVNVDGTFAYELDNGNAAVQALNDGDTLSESVQYTVDDGCGGTRTETLTVTIEGSDEPTGPGDAVDDLIDDVNQLLTDGDIRQGDARWLRRSLRNARRAINRGQPRQAVIHLRIFRAKVALLVAFNRLSYSDGVALFNSAGDILDDLV